MHCSAPAVPPVPADALHRRRVRAHHVQHHCRVVLHHAVRIVRSVLPVHATGNGATDQAAAVRADCLLRDLCLPHCGAVLRCPVRGGHGPGDYAARRARVLFGRRMEEQTCGIPVGYW